VTATTGVNVRACDRPHPSGAGPTKSARSIFDTTTTDAIAGELNGGDKMNIGKVERIIKIERIDEGALVRETELVQVPAAPEVVSA
jgi:hypothetical protein